jgi:hypothetical protein
VHYFLNDSNGFNNPSLEDTGNGFLCELYFFESNLTLQFKDYDLHFLLKKSLSIQSHT